MTRELSWVERFAGVGNPGDRVLGTWTRRLALVWVAVTVPLVAVAGLWIEGRGPYLVAWAVVCGLYTTPALLATWTVSRNVPEPVDRFWWRWLVAVGLAYAVGCTLMLYGFTGWTWVRSAVDVLLVGSSVMFGVALVTIMRLRMGGRAMLVDVTGVMLATVAVVAPVVLLLGNRVTDPAQAWFTIPAALIAVGLVATIVSAVVLFELLGPGDRVAEALGVSLSIAAAADAVAQTAQGMSSFTLPASVPLTVNAVCMVFLLLLPLYVPKDPAVGLDRLPPQQQVRKGGAVVALLTIVALPILTIEVVLIHDEVPWALPYAAGVVALMLVLATIRQHLTLRETKRLYALVERAAEERRRLLAELVRSVEDDRRRVAAQLHEQAVSSYAAFVAFIQATVGEAPEDDTSVRIARASTLVREDLANQTETLRELMLAVKPLSDAPIGGSLAAPIAAYVDNLYGDLGPPHLVLDLDDDLYFDWVSETVVLRIVQEALVNIWRHAGASRITVTIAVDDGVIEITIEDNGVGFDVDGLHHESGLATMRTFASYCDGAVDVESASGSGTTVQARLGARLPGDPEHRPPRLHLIEGGLDGGSRAEASTRAPRG